MFKTFRQPDVLLVALTAAGILAITMGARQSMGLFLGPLNTTTGLGITVISFAMAVGQFSWGLVQPLAGAAADRFGPARVLAVGIVLLAAGMALTPFMRRETGLILALGLLLPMGSGICSFSVLLGAAAQRLPEASRGQASGVINAGGSFGQSVFAPLIQMLIQTFGWMVALWSVAAVSLAALPLVAKLTRAPAAAQGQAPGTLPPSSDPAPDAKASPSPSSPGLWATVRSSLTQRDFVLLNLGFFTCGFHIAFLVTHLPTEVGLCGLSPSVASWSLAIIGVANILGSLYAGGCVARYRSKHVLASMYGARAVLIVLYLIAPKTEWTFYLFAAGLGFTWLATVPPTAAIVGKLFGVRYLATLFGLTLVSHQVGGFLGAWLGGQAITRLGSYDSMWYADMALAVAAALVNLPIREADPRHAMRPVAAATAGD